MLRQKWVLKGICHLIPEIRGKAANCEKELGKVKVTYFISKQEVPQ